MAVEDVVAQKIEDIEAVGNAFSAVFGKELGVAMTAVITAFVDPDMLVEKPMQWFKRTAPSFPFSRPA